MQVTATDIFRVGLGGASGGARKAAGAGNVAGAGSRGAQDVVSISDLARQMQVKAAQADQAGFVAKTASAASTKTPAKLGDALTGEVAKIYSYLNDDAKAKLEAGFAKGQLSVKDAEEALKYLANKEVGLKVFRSRERSPEETAAVKEFAETSALSFESNMISLSYSPLHRDLGIKRVAGEITDEEYNKQSAALDAATKEATTTGRFENLEERHEAARQNAMKMVSEGWRQALGGPPNEAKWTGSLEKLDAIGFDIHHYSNRQSFKNYAASQETPTMFRADAA